MVQIWPRHHAKFARAKEKHGKIPSGKLHTGPWHTEFLIKLHTGKSSPHWSNQRRTLTKLQRYLSGHCMVNDAKTCIPPKILSCVVCIKTIFLLWPRRFMALLAIHLQGCKCLRSRPGCRDLSKNDDTNKHSMEEQVWHLAFTTSNRCDRRLDMVSRAKQIYHCMMAGIELENYAIGHEMSDQRSEKPSIPTQQTWIPLGLGIRGNLIGVVLQSPSENILKRQLYVCEGLCWNSNTAETIFC